MFKKISLSLSIAGSFFAISACSNENPALRRAEIWQPQIDMPNSVVVCRSKQCAPAKLSMSKEYIYNSLLRLLDNNTQNKALICAADSSSHVCTENHLTLPITVGVTPANMYIDSVNISDISATLGSKSLNLLLNYYVTYNGQTPTCKPAQSIVYVKDESSILMEDSGYSCKMTTIGNTTIKTLFAIDYIDLDYGYIGGHYSIGLSGPAYGGGSGYMLLRLPHDAYPLTPELLAETPEEAKAREEAQAAEDAKLRAEIEAEIIARMEAEEQARIEAEKAKAQAEAEARAKAAAEAKAKAAEQARLRAQIEAEVRAELANGTANTENHDALSGAVSSSSGSSAYAVYCKDKKHCSPKADKKTSFAVPALPNENPRTISEQLGKAKNYNGVQIFPLAPKKKPVVSDVKADNALKSKEETATQIVTTPNNVSVTTQESTPSQKEKTTEKSESKTSAEKK